MFLSNTYDKLTEKAHITQRENKDVDIPNNFKQKHLPINTGKSNND